MKVKPAHALVLLSVILVTSRPSVAPCLADSETSSNAPLSPLRLVVDLEDVRGPDWGPSLAKGDPFLAELGIRILRASVAASDFRALGVEDVCQVLDSSTRAVADDGTVSQRRRKVLDLVRATHYLRAFTERSDDDSMQVSFRIVEPNDRTCAEGRSSKENVISTPMVITALKKTLASPDFSCRTPRADVVVAKAKPYEGLPIEPLLDTMRASVYRCLGIRYPKHEAWLLDRAANYLPAGGRPPTAGLDYFAERTALLLRTEHLALGEADALREIDQLLSEYAELGKDQSVYHLRRGERAAMEYWKKRAPIAIQVAKTEFEKASEIRPTSAEPHYWLGFLAHRGELLDVDRQYAVRQLQVAIDLNPGQLRARTFLAEELHSSHPERSREMFAAIDDVRDFPLALLERAWLAAEARNYEKATGLLDRAEHSGFSPVDRYLLRTLIALKTQEDLRSTQIYLVKALASDDPGLIAIFEDALQRRSSRADDEADMLFWRFQEGIEHRINARKTKAMLPDDSVLLGLVAAGLGDESRVRLLIDDLRRQATGYRDTHIWAGIAVLHALLGEEDLSRMATDWTLFGVIPS